MKKFSLIILVIVFSIYFLTGLRQTPYNYFTRLSASFLKGQYYLTQAPAWLNELVPVGSNKLAVIYPPMPAILMLPLTAFFPNLSQSLVSQITGALIGVLWFLIAYKKTKKDLVKSIWLASLVSFGNILWFLSSVGSVWYLGQVIAVLFLSFAFWEKTFQKRPLIIGFFLGMAFLSRVETIFAFLFFLFLEKSFNNKLKIILGVLPFVGFYLFYNFLRFNNPFQSGYGLIPHILEEPWYTKGLMHPFYIPRHLKIIFTSFPIFIQKFPYLIPSWNGLAIWITTPAFIYSFFNSLKLKVVKLAWISIFILAFFVFMHGTTGFSQFGYRFAAVFYPFLFFLIIKYLQKKKLRFHHWFLLTISILVNTWGVILINKFNLVSY